ncbi:MAG: leucine-rich repeat domain-containing protein [Candidatus Hodarchaeota archaeon]
MAVEKYHKYELAKPEADALFDIESEAGAYLRRVKQLEQPQVIPCIRAKRIINIAYVPRGEHVVGVRISPVWAASHQDVKLQDIPGSIQNLEHVEELEIVINSSRMGIPDEIGKLRSLKRLVLVTEYARAEGINSLPVSIGNLEGLEEMTIRLQLASLPDAIGNLKSLRSLVLWGNSLVALPDAIGNMRSLEKLDVNRNHLASLPDSIGMLSSLKKLDASTNELIKIPDAIGDLSNLESLNLCENKLKAIPSTIGKLGKLQWLGFAKNEISELPDMFENLTSLKHLVMSENRISRLPRSLSHLNGLRYFQLVDNALDHPLEELVDIFGPLALECRDRKNIIHVSKFTIVGFPKAMHGELLTKESFVKKKREWKKYIDGKWINIE